MKILSLSGLEYVYTKLKSKFVQQETGKGLSTNDYTDTEKAKVAGAEQTSNKVTVVTSSSTDTQYPTAKLLHDSLELKVDKESGKGLSTEDYTTAEKTKLSGIAEGANKTTVDNSLTSTSTTNALSAYQGKVLNDGKVDKETGKGLSTEDYTTAEKTKLAGIETGATKYTLPTATSSVLGGVKIGSNLSISDSVLSADVSTTQLNNKVDKETGKGLSTNDYTTDEKTKLAGINPTIYTGTLTAGSTSIDISNENITTNSKLSFYTSIYGVNPTAVTVVAGKATLTFDAQSADMEVGVKIDG